MDVAANQTAEGPSGYQALAGKACLSFSSALDALKNGERCRRAGWNGKGMFVYLVAGSVFQVSRAPLLGIYPEGSSIVYAPHIDMRTADGKCVPWLASQTDVLAEDWEVIPAAETAR